jgi:putative spermidine/putrescine transport system ATP-binding protein
MAKNCGVLVKLPASGQSARFRRGGSDISVSGGRVAVVETLAAVAPPQPANGVAIAASTLACILAMYCCALSTASNPLYTAAGARAPAACPPANAQQRIGSPSLMSFLVLDRLTKKFTEHTAVDSLSLAVAQGEFVSLLGPSGCGKTTTLQMIAGFVPPTSGAIRLEGRDLVAVHPSRRGLGIVFQSYALFPHMTVADNVAFGLDMQGIARSEREKRVADALHLVGLDGFAARYPRRMSGGQQQRVALARALVIRPRILLLDEPLSNLDAKLREEMQIELRMIQRASGTTTILVTHDQGEAMALSDRIVVMNKGRVEQIARPHEAYEQPATPFVAGFLGKTNVLAGRGDADGVTIGGGSWRVAGPPQGPVQATIRPERIGFDAERPDSLAGVVKARIFQGNHWLYQIDTAVGPVTVIRQNNGTADHGEGAAVNRTWAAQDMKRRPADGAGAASQ